MALNNFIIDLFDGKEIDKSFDKWKDETLAKRQQAHTQQMLYLQEHSQPRMQYEKEEKDFFEESKKRRDAFMKSKTSATLYDWLSFAMNMPDKNNISTLYTAFS
jgi:transposase